MYEYTYIVKDEIKHSFVTRYKAKTPREGVCGHKRSFWMFLFCCAESLICFICCIFQAQQSILGMQ